EWIRTNQPEIRAAMNQVADDIANAVDRIATILQRLKDMFGAIAPGLSLLGQFGGGEALAGVISTPVGVLISPDASSSRRGSVTNIDSTINMNVDPKTNADEVAKRLKPHIEQALSRQQNIFDSMEE